MKKDFKEGFKKVLNKDIGFKKINPNILSLFLKQLALLLDSSVSLLDSINIIKGQRLDKKLDKSLAKISSNLEKGYDSYLAFKSEEAHMGKLITAFIKSGDESGNLSQILDELSKYITEESKNKSKIKQALTYPIILLIVTAFIVILIVSKVMPTFVSVFEENSSKLPLSTRILLDLSSFLNKYGLVLILIILIIALILAYLRKNQKYGLKIDEFLFKLIIFKRFRLLNIEYQISSLLYILKKGDIPIIESIDIIKDSFSNYYIRKKFTKAKENLELGKSLSKSLDETCIFTKLFISMLRVGEDSGDMAKSLEKASDYFAKEYIFRLKRISSLAEPLLILFMSLIVAFVVFSVAIPMFESVNTF